VRKGLILIKFGYDLFLKHRIVNSEVEDRIEIQRIMIVEQIHVTSSTALQTLSGQYKVHSWLQDFEVPPASCYMYQK
jgi:hypothetical protein